MQHVEFQVVDTEQSLRMSFGRNADGSLDVARQTKEMTEYMDRLAKVREEQTRLGQPVFADWNPFPGWVKAIIKLMGEEYGVKVHFNDENRVYRFKIKGDREEYEDFVADFEQRFNAARQSDPEHVEWSSKNMVRVTSTPDNEMDALSELDAHHGGTQAAQAGQRPEKHKKEEVATPAAQS